jgi:hypothetical protein
MRLAVRPILAGPQPPDRPQPIPEALLQPGMSETTTLLKVGATDLVLRMIEDGALDEIAREIDWLFVGSHVT